MGDVGAFVLGNVVGRRKPPCVAMSSQQGRKSAIGNFQNHIVGFLTSGADVFWEEVERLRKDGLPVVNLLIAVLRDSDGLEGNPLMRVLDRLEVHPRQRRFWAAYTLGKLGDPQAIDPLIAALYEPDESLRESLCMVTVSALQQIGNPAVEPLITVLVHDTDRIARISAIRVLTAIGDSRAIEPLIKVLEDEDVGIWAASALGELGDLRAVGPLIAALHSYAPGERRPIITALWKIGDLCAIPPLLKTLRSCPDWMRDDILRALWRIPVAWVARTVSVRCRNLLVRVRTRVRETV